MGKFNALLNLRLKQKESQEPKITALAEKASGGDLSSFSGVFRVASLSTSEKNSLSDILNSHKQEETQDISPDLETLVAITSEVKAITNQAIILHGERIKRAQSLLKTYKEGAFTAWLINTYGNRQTPYNFLQYYEFYLTLPHELRIKMDQMPRQAIYSLASREGNVEQKKEIVKNYGGEAKNELLDRIREIFPLDQKDKRSLNVANQVIAALTRLKNLIDLPTFIPNKKQREIIENFLEEILITIRDGK